MFDGNRVGPKQGGWDIKANLSHLTSVPSAHPAPRLLSDHKEPLLPRTNLVPLPNLKQGVLTPEISNLLRFTKSMKFVTRSLLYLFLPLNLLNFQ